MRRLKPAMTQQGNQTSPSLRPTLGWAGLYSVRAVTQLALYAADEPELLGLAKTALGWPLTALAVLWTLRAARRTSRGHCLPA